MLCAFSNVPARDTAVYFEVDLLNSKYEEKAKAVVLTARTGSLPENPWLKKEGCFNEIHRHIFTAPSSLMRSMIMHDDGRHDMRDLNMTIEFSLIRLHSVCRGICNSNVGASPRVPSRGEIG